RVPAEGSASTPSCRSHPSSGSRISPRTRRPRSLEGARPVTDPIRVALVDDQSLVRAGFRLVIDSQPDLTVAAEAGDGEEAVRVLRSVEVDVVLMDVRMPKLDGLAATEQITSHVRPDREPPRVIVLTTFDLD